MTKPAGNREFSARQQRGAGIEGLAMAHQGDNAGFAQVLKKYKDDPDRDPYWDLMINAWGGQRDAANRSAAKIDKHHFGPVALWQQAHWCACGAPWDLEATPNFAAKSKRATCPGRRRPR